MLPKTATKNKGKVTYICKILDDKDSYSNNGTFSLALTAISPVTSVVYIEPPYSSSKPSGVDTICWKDIVSSKSWNIKSTVVYVHKCDWGLISNFVAHFEDNSKYAPSIEIFGRDAIDAYGFLPGPLFTQRTNVLPQDLVKYRSHEIRVSTFPIVLKFDRRLGSGFHEIWR